MLSTVLGNILGLVLTYLIMDERSYKWFLQELTDSDSQLKILETGICHGTKVISWYGNLKNDKIFCRPTKVVTKTKNLLNYFINSRIPIVQEYNPHKIICFLYHKAGKRLVTAKEAMELAENQLHGLHVTSIHMAVTSTPQIYTIKSSNSRGEYSTTITSSKFGSLETQTLKDSAQIEEVLHFFMSLNEVIMKLSNKEIHEINLDLTKDQMGAITLIKITELKFKFNSATNIHVRGSSIRLITQESSDEESLTDEESPSLARQTLTSYLAKEKCLSKVPIIKSSSNSQDFLKMIAKTIEKDRKKNYETTETQQEFGSRHQEFARKSFKDSKSMKNSLTSLKDLLFYLEKTRPRVWVQDKSEIQGSVRNSVMDFKNTFSNPKINSAKFSVQSTKNTKLDSITKDRSNRLFMRKRPSIKLSSKSV